MIGRRGKEDNIRASIITARTARVTGRLRTGNTSFNRNAITFENSTEIGFKKGDIDKYCIEETSNIPTFHCVTPSPTSTTSPADSWPDPHWYASAPLERGKSNSSGIPHLWLPSIPQFVHASRNAHHSYTGIISLKPTAFKTSNVPADSCCPNMHQYLTRTRFKLGFLNEMDFVRWIVECSYIGIRRRFLPIWDYSELRIIQDFARIINLGVSKNGCHPQRYKGEKERGIGTMGVPCSADGSCMVAITGPAGRVAG